MCPAALSLYVGLIEKQWTFPKVMKNRDKHQTAPSPNWSQHSQVGGPKLALFGEQRLQWTPQASCPNPGAFQGKRSVSWLSFLRYDRTYLKFLLAPQTFLGGKKVEDCMSRLQCYLYTRSGLSPCKYFSELFIPRMLETRTQCIFVTLFFSKQNQCWSSYLTLRLIYTLVKDLVETGYIILQ